jgi:hypothetical protein
VLRLLGFWLGYFVLSVALTLLLLGMAAGDMAVLVLTAPALAKSVRKK